MRRFITALFVAATMVLLSATAALACHTPPCHHARPSASILGPCGDPRYAFVLANPTSRNVTFEVVFTGQAGGLNTIDYTVVPGTQRRTKFFHVLGGSALSVTQKIDTWTSYYLRPLASAVAGPVGQYPSCGAGAGTAVITTL